MDNTYETIERKHKDVGGLNDLEENVCLVPGEDRKLDLTTEGVEKTNDPVRMYFREMGTTPLLTQAGETEIGKRIEKAGKASLKLCPVRRW